MPEVFWPGGGAPAGRAPEPAKLLRSEGAAGRRIEAERACVRLCTKGRTGRLLPPMAALESRLDPEPFLCMPRSTILRCDRLRRLRHKGLSGWCAQALGGDPLRPGRAFRRKVWIMATR